MRNLPKENYIYCKYCGEKLKRDHVGLYCGTRNCQWEYGLPEKDDLKARVGKSRSPLTPSTDREESE